MAEPMTSADIFIHFTGDFLGERGQRTGFLLLAAFLTSFLFIRTSARLIRSPKVPWWPGNVETSSGLHIHHLVWGICLLIAAGFMAFAVQPDSPWLELLAAAFGIGIGLTLDEFALWLHLEDVYWADEGRQSLDAVMIAAVLGGLVVVGAAPFDLEGQTGSVLAITGTAVWVLAWCLVAIMKGKLLLAAVGSFIPFVAQGAAIRLARPGSPWARRFYPPDSAKADKAAERDRRRLEFRRRWLNRIGGAPSPQSRP